METCYGYIEAKEPLNKDEAKGIDIKRFVENNLPWAHLDIAGVSWTMKGGKNSISKVHSPGATAFGVRIIDKILTKK